MSNIIKSRNSFNNSIFETRLTTTENNNSLQNTTYDFYKNKYKNNFKNYNKYKKLRISLLKKDAKNVNNSYRNSNIKNISEFKIKNKSTLLSIKKYKEKYKKPENIYKNFFLKNCNYFTDENLNNKTLTIPKIKIEIEEMKKFLNYSPINTDPLILKKNLGYKQIYNDKYSSNYDQFNTSLNSNSLNKLIKQKKLVLNETNPKWNKFINQVSNPSIGLEGTKKKFPIFSNFAKYKNTFNFNYLSKKLDTLTLAERVGMNQSERNKFDLKKKNQLTQKSRLRLKCKVIEWFLKSKKIVIDKLLEKNFQNQLFAFSSKKNKEFHSGLSIEDFSSLLKNNNITKNPELIQKLFWVLDEDGDNDLTYKEIMMGMEIFRDTNPEQKVTNFFRLCSKGDSDKISKENFKELLKRNIIDKEDNDSLKKCVEKIFHKYGNDNELTLEQLLKGFKEDQEFSRILNKNMLNLHTINSNIDDEIKKDLIMFNAEQNKIIQNKVLNINEGKNKILEIKFGNFIDELVNTKLKLHQFQSENEFLEED